MVNAARQSGPAFVAAATKIDIGDTAQIMKLRRTRQEWQDDAWNYFDAVGEVKYSSYYLGNAMSKLKLFVGEVDGDNDPVPTTNTAAIEALDRLQPIGEILRRLTINLMVPGECYLIGMSAVAGRNDKEHWDIRSIDEVKAGPDGTLQIKDVPWSSAYTSLTKEDFALRIWQRHPRYAAEADSPMRGVLSACQELVTLDRALRSLAQSRIAGPGLILVPSELSFGNLPASTEDAGDGAARRDPFARELMEAMITPIQNENDASAVVPMLVRGNAEYLKELRHLVLDRPMDAMLEARTVRALRRLAQGLNVPVEVVLGVEDVNHWCVDNETEALTRRGWLRQAELRDDDELLTLNHVTGLSEWASIDGMYRTSVTEEPMLSIETVGHSSLTTLGHRWPTLYDGRPRWRTSSTLTLMDHLIRAADCAELPQSQKWSDEFVELLAWFWTEGSQSGTRISIAQSHHANPERVARIRACLTRLYGPAGRKPGAWWRESIQQNRTSLGRPVTVFYLNKEASEPFLGQKRPDPALVMQMTRAQLALFIDISLQGDGWHYRSGAMDIFQKDRARLDALELAAILSGYAVTTSPTPGGWRLCISRKRTQRPVKAARENQRIAGAGARIEQVPYSGTIWCPTTRNGTWLARRHGRVFYTGNSAWAIKEDTFQAHIEPVALLECEALTTGYLRPALEVSDMSADEAAQFVVWYDASGLVVRPDRGADAKDAHDKIVISDKALREVLDFDDDDAPDPEEAALRHGIKRGTVDPAVVLALLKLIDPNLNVGAEPVKETVPAGGATTPSPAGPPNSPPEQKQPEPKQPVRASAARPLGLQLAELDRILRARLLGAAEASLSRALERVGAKLATKARKDPATTASILAGARETASARLGPSLVASLGLEEAALLEGAFADLKPKFIAWVEQTTDRALLMVPRISQERIEAAQARFRPAVADAWLWFAEQLRQVASDQLYEPGPVAPAAGEFDPTMRVPFGLVRGAVARAGNDRAVAQAGMVADATNYGVFINAGSQPAAGVATGQIVEDVMADSGVSTGGWEWVYGPYPRAHPFEPHEVLDGAMFENYDDDVLINNGDFPPTSHFYPGDHDGCVCDAVPILTDEELAAEPVSSVEEMAPLDRPELVAEEPLADPEAQDAISTMQSYQGVLPDALEVMSISDLPVEFAQAIETWTSSASGANEMLQQLGLAADEQTQTGVGGLERLLKQAPQIDAPLYRGLHAVTDETAFVEGLSVDIKAGSFTQSEDMARGFDGGTGETPGVVFKVQGAYGLPITPWSAHPTEFETIVTGRYRIVSVLERTMARSGVSSTLGPLRQLVVELELEGRIM